MIQDWQFIRGPARGLRFPGINGFCMIISHHFHDKNSCVMRNTKKKGYIVNNSKKNKTIKKMQNIQYETLGLIITFFR